ncbi:hypothetical protein [Variovorax sp. J31P207]|uniref:hypothetical protein n=1 Tax=Variovorax sp. J31P207 TaxID=3053510 RepID=UPI002578CAAF|nr:hypothetical protein [Variovorax sp. J31P207]MDM0068400.1 hypothetical protein [Variovorax sp. J31P207]
MLLDLLAAFLGLVVAAHPRILLESDLWAGLLCRLAMIKVRGKRCDSDPAAASRNMRFRRGF